VAVRNCEGVYLKLFVDGVEFKPGDIKRCSGEVVNFTTQTNLDEPITWQWSLDGTPHQGALLLSDTSSLSYTFDADRHTLHMSAQGQSCGKGFVLTLRGRECDNICPVKCSIETAYFPAGALISMVDAAGLVYLLSPAAILNCGSKKDALKAADQIKKMIMDKMGCEMDTFSVIITPSYMNPTCLKLELKNSPVKMKFIQVGNIAYPFSVNKC